LNAYGAWTDQEADAIMQCREHLHIFAAMLK